MTLPDYMKNTYMWLCISLLISALTSWLVTSDPVIAGLFFKGHSLTLLGLITIFSPIVVILVMSFLSTKLPLAAVQGLFILFSCLYGISLASLLIHYTASSVVGTFIVTAGAFAGLSLYGGMTKRNLGMLGTFMMVLLVGIFLAGIVNMFLHSVHLNFAITLVGLIVYGGLTAWDTQKIKTDFMNYASSLPESELGKMTILSALSLYIDFIGMFQNLLSLIGTRDD